MNHRVIFCKANELVPLSNAHRCWFHTTDPFCKMEFIDDGIYTNSDTNVIIIDHQTETVEPTFHHLFRNGHIASALTSPLDNHVYVSLTFFDSSYTLFSVNWTSTVENTSIDFISNGISYTYGTYDLLSFEGVLYYDLDVELSNVLFNEFTVVVDMDTQYVETISMKLFSEIPIEFHPTTNGRNFYIVVVTFQNDERVFHQYINDVLIQTVTRSIDNSNLEIHCTRDRYNQHVTVHKLLKNSYRLKMYHRR